jgi:hypothetical protein
MSNDIKTRLLKMADHLGQWAARLEQERGKQLRVDETWTTLELNPEQATRLIDSLKSWPQICGIPTCLIWLHCASGRRLAMGKHETGYARVKRDHYPTPSWVIAALAEHLELRGLTVWEPACGDGRMDLALRSAGCKCVFATDIVDHGSPQDEVLDFLSGETPAPLLDPIDLICTNPPFGQGGTLATAFIEVGLRHISKPTSRVIGNQAHLALLLPCDFDSAKTRARFFADCPHFVAKVVLTKRIVWFGRSDGVREAPKENHAWFVWNRSSLRVRQAPVILYSPAAAERELPYDGARDFAESIDACYRAIRERVAAGGPSWRSQ